MTGDSLVLGPGESRVLDGIFVGLGGIRASMDDYTKYVAELHPSPVARKPALGGWGSWSLYYVNITADALRQEADFAKANYSPAGLDDFLLDDGYETHWGSWSASPMFGADLDTLSQEQATSGLRPAIWLAPFYIAIDDPSVTQHPDWFVHGTDKKLRTYNNVGGDYAALDVTHPDARAFVVKAAQQLRAWGFRTLKIDFLFGAAVEGVRQKPITSLESYSLWMKTLREAVPDVLLVGCGAPILPSVGWVDSRRVGSDIAFSVSPGPRYAFYASAARNALFRASTDAWWSLDPDVVLLRGDAITDADAWTIVVFSALSGGNYLLGEGKQTSDLRRSMALSRDILAIARDGIAARALDMAAATDSKVYSTPLFVSTTAIPHLWKKTSADGNHGALGVFGWELERYVAQVELPSGAQELVAPSAPGPTQKGPAGGKRAVDLAQHSTRVFAW